jgi:hypothetical protein
VRIPGVQHFVVSRTTDNQLFCVPKRRGWGGGMDSGPLRMKRAVPALIPDGNQRRVRKKGGRPGAAPSIFRPAPQASVGKRISAAVSPTGGHYRAITAQIKVSRILRISEAPTCKVHHRRVPGIIFVAADDIPERYESIACTEFSGEPPPGRSDELRVHATSQLLELAD